MVPVKNPQKQKTHDLSRRKRRGRRSPWSVSEPGTNGAGIFATRAKKRPAGDEKNSGGDGQYCNNEQDSSLVSGKAAESRSERIMCVLTL